MEVSPYAWASASASSISVTMPSSTSTSRRCRPDSSAALTAAESTVGLTPRTRSASRIGPCVWYMRRRLPGSLHLRKVSQPRVVQVRSARDVVLQLPAVGLQLAHPVGDDIADGHN